MTEAAAERVDPIERAILASPVDVIQGGAVDLERNKELVRRFTQEVMNEGNLDALDRYLSPDFVNHVTGGTGVAAYRSVVEWARRLQGEGGMNVIDDLIAEGERVSVFITRQRVTID